MAFDTSTRRILFVMAGVVFLLASLYGLVGFLQAVMLFTGERALKNSNIWSSVLLVAAAFAVISFAESRIPQKEGGAFLGAIPRGLIFVCVLLSTASTVRFLSDFMMIDACLDRGGSFDYVRSLCDTANTTNSYPAMSLFEWRGFFLTSAVVFAVPVVLVAAKRRRAKEDLVAKK